MLRWVVLTLTAVTGFTGLAYEVTWQKYLGILLGAHGEATASVLGLFLGGLSLGYWMLGALARNLGDATRVHALVSAPNTAGAFAGALATGFVLIRWLGLEAILYRMGAVNLAVGALFALLGVKRRELAALDAGSAPVPAPGA